MSDQASITRTVELEPPTAEYVIALYEELRTAYASQDREVEELREWRELKAAVPVDEDYRLVQVEVRDATIADEAQRRAATLALNRPTLIITPAKPSDTADKNSTLLEKWTTELLWSIGRNKVGMHTYSAIVDACLNDGGAWHKLVFARDIWDHRYGLKIDDFKDEWGKDENGRRKKLKTKDKAFDEATEEAKKRAGPPLRWQSVDVLTVYPVFFGDQLGEVIEAVERPRLATLRKYRLGKNDNGDIVPQEVGQGEPVDKISGTQPTVKFLTHTNDRWITYVVADQNNEGRYTGQVVNRIRHDYGKPNYYFAPGLWMSHWRNRKVGWSISRAKLWLVKYRSFLMTMHAQAVARDTLPPLFQTVPEGAAPLLGDDGKPRKREQWKPGEMIPGRPGETLAPVQFPKVLEAIEKEMAIVDAQIERLETPRPTGNLGNLEGAGFAISQVLSESRIRDDPQAQSIERSLTELTYDLWRLVRDVIGEKVWVTGEGDNAGYIGAGPEDLGNDVGVKWQVNPERPEAELIKARYWHECIKEGTASIDQAIEGMGRNPDEVRRGRLLDELRQEPWYKNWLRQRLLEEIGMADMAEADTIADQLALTGAPGMGMAGGPMAMGNEIVPDMGNLAMSPGGQGAAPINPTPPGAMQGPQVPQRSAAGAGIQQIVG